MKKLFFTFFFLFLFFNFSIAQSKFRFTIGPTISSFLDAENSSPKIGIAIGIHREFHLYKKIFLSAGVGFASRGAILENRTIRPYASEPTDAFYQDIHGMIGYLEIPLVFQYVFPITQRIRLIPLLGPIVSFRIKDLSHFEQKQFYDVYIPHQSNPLDYNFAFEQESGFLNNSFLKLPLSFGFRVTYKKLGFEVRYILDNQGVYYFDNLSEVHHKMHSLYFLVSL